VAILLLSTNYRMALRLELKLKLQGTFATGSCFLASSSFLSNSTISA
jgi:hypothetical protein